MKNNYISTASRWLFLFGLLISQALFAQTAPVIQWQRVLPGITDLKAVKTSNGDIITTNGPNVLKLSGASGAEQWKTTLPTTYQYAIGVDLAPLPDGGVVVLARDPYKWLLIRLSSSGTVQWMNPFRLITQPGELTQTRITRVIQASDGGYVVMGSTQFGRDGSSTNLYKFDADGTLIKDRGIGYVYSNSPRPISVGNSIVQTSDGSYLLVGETSDGLGTGFRGWVAKLNNQLSTIWQNRYELTRRFTDVTNATDGQNYLITGLTAATLPSFAGILAIDASGQPIQDLRSDTQTGDTYFFTGNALIAPLPGNSPARSILLTTSSSSRGNDFRLSTPGLTLSLGGSGDETVSSLITTPDGGYLLTGTTTSTDGDVQGKTDNTPSGWVVKLAPVEPLTLNAPTYDCSTGAITFNVSGGNGSPITFSAPGISRPSLTSTTGTVEQGLRNDPKTIFIVANQSGQQAPYIFDLKAACTGTTPTPPVNPTPPTTGGTLTLTQPTYNCSTGAITFNSTGGDGSTITYSAPGIMRSSATSNTGTVEQGLRNDPKTLMITAMQSGQATTYSFDFKAFCSGNTPAPSSTLKLLAPVVDCSTRRITLTTSGGDGSAITFTTPNITRGSETSPIGTVDYCVGNQPLTLLATQSGYTAVYEGFDFTKVCPNAVVYKPLTAVQVPDLTVVVNAGFSYIFSNYFADPTTAPAYQPSFTFQATGLPAALTFTPQQNVSTRNPAFGFYGILSNPAVYTVTVSASNGCLPAASTTFKLIVNPVSGSSPLTLVAPTYNCSTGAFMFNYTGGNGAPVEFQAAGITGWTTNPNQFVDKDSRTANDVKPFTLMARQNGQVVTYTWDLKAACGRSARMAALEAGQLMQLTVKGNPVGNTAIVAISGVEGQPVQLDLLNASGHVLEQRHIEQAGAVDEQRFDLQRQPSGMLLLRAQSGQQRQTVKLIKQ